MDKISYHLHVSELVKFLEEIPGQPILLPPECRPVFDEFTFQPLDDGNHFVLRCKSNREFVAAFFDTNGEFDDSDAEKLSRILLEGSEQMWKGLGCEWSVRSDPFPIYHFDLNNDGQVDRVYVASPDGGGETIQYDREGSNWRVGRSDEDFLDTVRFNSVTSQRVYETQRKQLPPRLRK